MIHFQHIEYLLALALIPLMILLYAYVIRSKKNTLKKIGDPVLVNQLIKDYSPVKFSLKFLLIVSAFAIGIIALANPRKPQGTAVVNRSGIDVMIALDVSKSMLANDIKPSRLERAKQFIAKLIDKLPDDRIGIVVFAGRAYLQMPLTTDHSAAKMYLSSATTDVVPTQGTVISDALKMCFTAFNSQEKMYKTIVLISDGEDHDESAIKITKAMAEEGVMINTIGIGSPEGTTIIDPATNETKVDETGSPVITKLNEDELKNIATTGNGLYELFTNTDEVVDNMDKQLKSMGQRAITENSLVDYKNFFQRLLLVSLILLLLEFFITEIKSTGKIPDARIKNQPVTLLALFLLIPSILLAQNDNALIKKGNDAYKRKEYDIATENYKKVTEKDPDNEKAQYNLGNTLYKKGNNEEAIKAYDESIKISKSKKDQSSAWYNKGVSFQNNKKLPECIAAYKNSLRLNPDDEDARFNLQKALLQQKQQKDKEENEKKKPREDQKQKDKQQQQKDDKDKNEQPKPQPSKMTQKEAEEKLKALLQQEKNLQDKLRKVDAATPNKPEKDW